MRGSNGHSPFYDRNIARGVLLELENYQTYKRLCGVDQWNYCFWPLRGPKGEDPLGDLKFQKKGRTSKE